MAELKTTDSTGRSIDRCDPNDPILVPRMPNDADGWDHTTPGPAWISVVNTEHKPVKPLIKCKCGVVSGIGLHHVYADGKVMNSLLCSPCCGWHVYIKLLDYNLGEFLPEPKRG